MLQGRYVARFTVETHQEIRLVCQFRPQHLDGNHPVIPGVRGPVDGRHLPRCGNVFDLVRSQLLTR